MQLSELVEEWRELLDGCSRIFFHAPGTNSRGLFPAAKKKSDKQRGKQPVFTKDDPRIRTVPSARLSFY